MSKFLTAFKYASIVSVLVNAIGFIIAVLLNGLESTLSDYIEIAPLPLSLSFFPCFFSIYYFNDKSSENLKTRLKHIIKPMILSFGVIYTIVYLTIRFYKTNQTEILFWNKPSLFNGITAIIIVVFSSLIYYLLNHRKITKRDYGKTALSIKIVTLIWLIGTLLYLSIVSILQDITLQDILLLRFALLIAFFGVIASVIVFLGVKYIISRQNKPITNKVFIIVYFINVILLPVLFIESLGLLETFFDGLYRYNSSKSIEVILVRGVVLYGPYFLLLTLSIHIYFIYEINRNQKQNLKQIGVAASLKYQQLKAQLSPHFLFNNISVLTGLIEENQERAVLFSEKLSNIYRYFLNQENQDLVLLKEELAFAKEYLELLQVRFEKAITFSNKTEKLTEYYILPMTLQQVFENVIKHNEISIETPICIEMVIDENYLVITNNKNPKIDIENGKKTGLKNIISRYVFFTDEKVILDNNIQHFSIKLPLLKIEV